MKKRMCKIMALAMTAAMVVPMAAQTTAFAADDKEITYWNIAVESPDKDIVTAAVDKFNKETKSGYTVNSVAIQNDTYKEKLVIAMSSGECPDMYSSWSGGPMYEYIDSGFAQPIDDLLDQSDVKDKLLDAAIEQGSYNGHVYAIPYLNVSLAGIFYNKDMFKQYGLEEPKTLADLENICATLKENGITPFALANASKWTGSMYFMSLAARYGGLEPFQNAVAGTGKFTDDCFIKAGEKIQEWVNNGYFPDGVNSLSEDDGQAKQLMYQETAGMLLCGGELQASNRMTEMHVCLADAIQKDNRPEISNRLFRSNAVEKEILRVQKLLKNAKLAWMFTNCFPNTLDTTVHFRKGSDGKPDTFVYTGDIHAMWLRDSGAQVWPYVQLANADPELKEMLAGVILRQFKCINIDPYANAFNDGAIPDGHWMSDLTDMKPELHERKWEIDSLCYPLRLAYHYWKTTGDASIFDEEWIQAITNVLKTFKEQQRKDGVGPYKFQRKTERALDTVSNDGLGAPVKPVGLIVSSFRPSDDATTLQFLVPSNFFAVSSLRKAAEILEKVNKKTALSKECKDLAQEVETALKKYAVYNHPKYGKIYAFEVDGFGNHHLMDDANVPSLLAMPYLGDVNVNDPIYQNTRRFVWSEDNPYFFKGKAGEGIGGPHIGYDMVWPMSIMMKAFTSQNDAEIKTCIKMLMDTDADTGFMHESFHKDNPKKFTRAWFAWQNTLFGELILKLVNEGKVDLLNSIQ